MGNLGNLTGYRSIYWPIIRKALANLKKEIIVDEQRSWRYIDLIGGAMFLAEEIDKRSSSKHVGLMLPTSGLFPMGFLACWFAGRVPVPLNYLLKPEEQDYIVADSGIDLVISVRQMLDFLGYEPKGVGLLNLDEIKDKFKGIPPFRIPPLVDCEETAIILYTSGTSGKPKGVMLTHDNLISQMKTISSYPELSEAKCFGGVLPQFHSFGLTPLTLLPLTLGKKVAYQARFVPKQVVKMIHKHQVDVFLGIPSMYNALLGVKDAGKEEMKSITFSVSGGAPLPDALFTAFNEKYGVKILEGYGLTETSPVVCWNTHNAWSYTSVGQLLPEQEVQIRDEGKIMPRGEEGEIYLKGPNIMKGYYKKPELTAEVLDAEGWFKTGDWGKYDDQGYLYITGRVKEMLIIGGENVFPREIEEILNRDETVKDSCVVGRPDDSRGEVPIAFIEMVEDTEFDQQRLRGLCRESLAGFKVPKEIRVMEELPRTPTGKLLRRDLMQIIKDEMANA